MMEEEGGGGGAALGVRKYRVMLQQVGGRALGVDGWIDGG